MITHIHHDIPSLSRIDGNGDRVYLTPSGNKYPSVTSVVSLLHAEKIAKWRAEVGAEQAAQISGRASRRGTKIHNLCEQYLLNNSVTPDVFDTETWNSLLPHLQGINNVHCLETQLYSDHLRVAGTVDCIGQYRGKLSVIDFKTSSRPKTRDEISNYFMQTAAYAVMFEERTGIPVSRLVILMAVDDQPEASVFVERRDDWIDSFIKLRKDYAKWKGY